MTLTNELNLPEPIVAAIKNDGYDAGRSDYSVTGLLKPPRIVALQRKWAEHLREDAAERIFSLIGRSIHGILEKAASARYIVEKRYFSEFGDHPKIISGQIDVFDSETGTLSDYKVTSRWTAADGIKADWQAQASMNALLMARNGITVKKAQIVCIYRDFSKMQASRDREYPQRQIEIFPVSLWSAAQTEQFILERIALHEAAKTELPLCSPDEQWAKPTKFALMRKGQKKAVKLYETDKQAQAAVTDPKKEYIELRPGQLTRCEFYCSCAPYCEQYREVLNELR